MNRRFAWLGAFAGGVVMFRWLKRDRRKPESSTSTDGDPAAELRAKLEESRTAAAEPETTVDAAPDPEARRREVHEAARKRIDGLRGE